MDLELPGISGIEATRQLKQLAPNLSVVLLTAFEEPITILEAITAGADGYLLKKASANESLSQLGMITQGGSPLTAGWASPAFPSRGRLRVVRRKQWREWERLETCVGLRTPA